MTKNLKLFVLFSLLWSVLFFTVLNWCLLKPESRSLVILFATITYGLGFSVAGSSLGKRDPQAKATYALWPRYMLTGSLSSFVVGGVWVALFRHDEWNTLIWIGLSVIVQFVIIFVILKNSIKGMPKKNLFP